MNSQQAFMSSFRIFRCEVSVLDLPISITIAGLGMTGDLTGFCQFKLAIKHHNFAMNKLLRAFFPIDAYFRLTFILEAEGTDLIGIVK